MAAITFDTLAYARKLEKAGVNRAEAEAQAQGIRELVEAQSAAMNADAERRNELATKADWRETELALRADLRETELRLQKEIAKIKFDMLKWGVAGWLSLAAIMAKGFHWLGF